jgi:DNA-binding XRE family transcriptional regulator
MYSNLAKLRKERGITQKYMADLIGVKNTSTYNRKERGHVQFKINEMEAIKDLFQLPTDEIFLKFKSI